MRLLYLPILASADDEAAQGNRPGQLAARLESAELGRRLSKPRCYPVVAAGRYCVATVVTFFSDD